MRDVPQRARRKLDLASLLKVCPQCLGDLVFRADFSGEGETKDKVEGEAVTPHLGGVRRTDAEFFQIVGRITVVSARVRHACFEGATEAPHFDRAALVIGQ